MAKNNSLFANTQVADTVGIYRGRLDVGNTGSSNWVGEGPCVFEVDVPFTAAQLNAGSVTLIDPAVVPRGLKLYVTDWAIRFGGVAFATANDARISTLAAASDANAVADFVTVAAANTTGYASRGAGTTPSTGVTQGTPFREGTGGTVNQGLQLRLATAGGVTTTGTAGAAGSVYVRGYLGL